MYDRRAPQLKRVFTIAAGAGAGGKCAWCGLYLRDEDVTEIDHRTPEARGGQHQYVNWQLIHRHCHDTKTAADATAARSGTTDKDHTIEEPCEGKLSARF
jgi:RNA-directed DNA polymerase